MVADMYRCVLNKQKDQPTATRVPLHEYKGALTRYGPRRVRSPEPESDPPGSFVLFHADLARTCGARGVLAASDPGGMWAVVSRHCESWQDDAEDDPDKVADQR